MIALDTIEPLRDAIAAARADGRRIGLVPTMGFLHEGHLTLCDVARQHSDFVVLSIFVNPLQFGAGEDLEQYPRDLVRDAHLVTARGVHALFAPPASVMYPAGGAAVRLTAPALTDVLCGRFRPGHFDGVLTVVAKLFNIVRPDVAVFGQKDLQQSVLVRRMVRDLDFPVDVLVAPIIRESDGLALSSRNSYLDRSQRRAATVLHRALLSAQAAFTAGETDPPALTAAAADVLDAQRGVTVQYVEIVDTESLEMPGTVHAGHAMAVAAFVGSTRLIDNHVFT